MKFHCILCTRDCADIVFESLQTKADWADYVYVYDTGSRDGTWEMVQDFARGNTRIVPLRREEVVFHEGIRAYVFDAIRDNIEEGDWVVKSDEDEFYHVSPREFVSKQLKPHETAVWTQLYDFRLTREEAIRQLDSEFLKQERMIPLISRRRFYVPMPYSEHRLCQFRKNMKWYPTGSFPTNAGFVARARIPLRHYPHRDVEQLKRRVALRNAMAEARGAMGAISLCCANSRPDAQTVSRGLQARGITRKTCRRVVPKRHLGSTKAHDGNGINHNQKPSRRIA